MKSAIFYGVILIALIILSQGAPLVMLTVATAIGGLWGLFAMMLCFAAIIYAFHKSLEWTASKLELS